MRQLFPLIACMAFLATKAQTGPNNDTTLKHEIIFAGATKDMNESHAMAVKQTVDGGPIVAGYTNANDGDISGNQGGYDGFIVRLNAAGGIIWKKCFGGTGDDMLYAIDTVTGGGFIAVGSSDSHEWGGNHGLTDFWVLRLDADGNVLWQKSLGGSNDDIAYSVQSIKDTGFVIAGQTSSNDGDVSGNHGFSHFGNADAWVIRLSNAGSFVWKKCYGSTGSDFATTVRKTLDGGLLIAGSAGGNDGNVSGSHGGGDFWIFKTNMNGKILWQKNFGGTALDQPNDIQPTADSGFIAAGFTMSSDGDVVLGGVTGLAKKTWVIKVDKDNNIQWQKPMGRINGDFTLSANAIAVAGNGDFITVGDRQSALLTDNPGNLGWLTTFDGEGNIKSQHKNASQLAAIALGTGEFAIVAGSFSDRFDQFLNDYIYKYYIGVYNANALPLSIIQFNAAKKQETILLHWQTAFEQNTGYFNIQRSADAMHFTTIGKVAAAGSSAVMQQYSYTDDIAKAAINNPALFYRLQEVDKDGKTTLSKTVKVALNDINTMLLAVPNPVTNTLNLRVNNYTGKATFTIVDMAGRTVSKNTANINGNTAINVAALAKGTYIVRAIINGNIVEQKFVKQ